MKRISKAIIFSIITLVSVTALAQKPPEYTKPEVIVEYDRFKDETTVSAIIPLRPGNMATDLAVRDYMNSRLGALAGAVNNLDHLTLVIMSRSLGTKPIAHSKVVVGIISLSGKQRISTDRELIILVDGERIRCGSLSAVDSKTENNLFYESIAGPIDSSNLLSVSKGKKVEGRIGSAEFELSGERLRGSKTLYRN